MLSILKKLTIEYNREMQESRALAESMGNASSVFTFDRNKVGGVVHGGFDFYANAAFGITTSC